MKTNYEKKLFLKNKLLICLLFILLACTIVLTLPYLIIGTIGRTLDQSWHIGLLKAADEGFIYGKDIVFTYGPLGFLTIPIFIKKSLWIYSATYILITYTLTILGCSLYIRKTKANLVKIIVFAAVFVVIFRNVLGLPPGRDFDLAFSIFIFSYLYILGQRKLIPLAALAFLYSILPFIKFSTVLTGSITGIVFLCILIKNKNIKEALTFIIAYLISFCVIGLLLFKSPKAIFTYLYGCWQIASGFNDAMGFDGNKINILFIIFVWISYISLLCYCIFRKRRYDAIYLMLGFGTLFLSFKQGFIRHDPEHIVYFYAMWLVIFGLYSLKSFADAKKFGYVVWLFTFIILYQYLTETHSFPKLYHTSYFMKDARTCGRLLYENDIPKQLAATTKKILQKYNRLKIETVQTLTGHTMDVFPYEVAVTEAYGLQWNPRPVFQSFSAYTKYLDSLNAKHFLSDSAPEYILYALGTIDNRYAIFDEPATFRTLLQKYRPVMQDGKFIILQKNSFANDRIEEHISTEYGKFGQTIPLPKCEDGMLLFAKIRIEQNWTGLGRKFLYKSPNVYVTFLNNGEIIGKESQRFIFSNAMNGVFISQYIADQNNLLKVWKGNIRQDITGILFQTKHPEFFKNKITVDFFKMSKETIVSSTGCR